MTLYQLRYRDHARRQRELVTPDRRYQLLRHWRDRLGGVDPDVLPLDLPRPERTDHRGIDLPFEFDRQTSDAVRQLARQTNATLFAVLLAAYAIMVHAWGGRRDVVIGVPASGRSSADTHALIGCFVNALPIVVRVDPGATVAELVSEVVTCLVDAQENQDLPLEQLVGSLGLPRDPSRNPLYNVWFDVNSFGATPTSSLLREVPQGDTGRGGVESVTRLDTSIVLDDGRERLAGRLTYAVSLFRKESAQRFLDTFRSIVIQIARAGSGSTVSEIELVSEREAMAQRDLEKTGTFVVSDVFRRIPTGALGRLLVAAPGQDVACARDTGERGRWLADGTIERVPTDVGTARRRRGMR